MINVYAKLTWLHAVRLGVRSLSHAVTESNNNFLYRALNKGGITQWQRKAAEYLTA